MNQVDLMTALTTTRFQTINEMKHFKETLLHESSSLSHFNNNNHHQQQHQNNSFLDAMSIHDSFISFDSNHNHLHDRKNKDINNINSNYVCNATFEELKSEIFKTNFKYNLGQFEHLSIITIIIFAIKILTINIFSNNH